LYRAAFEAELRRVNIFGSAGYTKHYWGSPFGREGRRGCGKRAGLYHQMQGFGQPFLDGKGYYL
jgi:hypothetical protein